MYTRNWFIVGVVLGLIVTIWDIVYLSICFSRGNVASGVVMILAVACGVFGTACFYQGLRSLDD